MLEFVGEIAVREMEKWIEKNRMLMEEEEEKEEEEREEEEDEELENRGEDGKGDRRGRWKRKRRKSMKEMYCVDYDEICLLFDGELYFLSMCGKEIEEMIWKGEREEREKVHDEKEIWAEKRRRMWEGVESDNRDEILHSDEEPEEPEEDSEAEDRFTLLSEWKQQRRSQAIVGNESDWNLIRKGKAILSEITLHDPHEGQTRNMM